MSQSAAAVAFLPVIIPAEITSKAHKTGLVFDSRYILYSPGEWHPESPERLIAIKQRFNKDEIFPKIHLIPVNGNPKKYISAVHPQEHITAIKNYDRDLHVHELAVAGVLRAVDAVCKGTVNNAFCAIRPPGHHAGNNGFAGFCFYNNVAIAARYAQMKHNLQKVLIVDWDYHHGNGTEWAFYSDPTVLFFSTHALYAYPRTGQPEKTGQGAGKGFNINVPLPPGADDKRIITAFEEKLLPAAEQFQPDIIFISAGFDSRIDDDLGDFAVTDEGFVELTKMVMGIAAKYSGSRIVSVLEGGYNPEGLASAVEEHVKTLIG